MRAPAWPDIEAIGTARLTLEPLAVTHADAMFPVLREPALYRYLDYGPHPDIAHTRAVYARLVARTSPDGRERWLNWIVVPRGGEAVGFVQATVRDAGTAWIAYLFATAAQHHGYASEAVPAMMANLRDRHGVVRFLACVERDNAPSIALLGRCGLRGASSREADEQRVDPGDLLYVG